MRKCLAFVLGGGGARGAMQVGALRALLEAGYRPDLLVGTSIGAVNAAGLALWGVNLDGVVALEGAYQEIAEANLMDPHLGRLTLRTLSGRPNHHASQRVKEYFIASGISPDLRFYQIKNARLGLIAADLGSGRPVIYGQDPGQSVLDGLMASIALPPWFAPVEKDGQQIVDGGLVSNLPIEPAQAMGATEIIALELDDPRSNPGNDHALIQYLGKLVYALSQRHISLETDLAESKGIPVHCIELRSPQITPIWDFSNYRDLIEIGYETASRRIEIWSKTNQTEFAMSAQYV